MLFHSDLDPAFHVIADPMFHDAKLKFALERSFLTFQQSSTGTPQKMYLFRKFKVLLRILFQLYRTVPTKYMYRTS